MLGNEPNRYHIIAWTEETGSQAIESFDTLEECRELFQSMTDPSNTNPFYDDLREVGGHLRIEDSEGNGGF